MMSNNLIAGISINRRNQSLAYILHRQTDRQTDRTKSSKQLKIFSPSSPLLGEDKVRGIIFNRHCEERSDEAISYWMNLLSFVKFVS